MARDLRSTGSHLSGEADTSSSSLRDIDPSRRAAALGCDYTGYEFGGGYLDSICCEGYLWDLDSCDEPGGGLSHGGDWPCPRCNTAQMLEDAKDEALNGCCGESMRNPWCAMTRWEATCEKAMQENPAVAEPLLRSYGELEIEDWPDREAVYAGRARWDVTIPRRWTWDAQAIEARRAETQSGSACESAVTEGQAPQ